MFPWGRAGEKPFVTFSSGGGGDDCDEEGGTMRRKQSFADRLSRRLHLVGGRGGSELQKTLY